MISLQGTDLAKDVCQTGKGLCRYKLVSATTHCDGAPIVRCEKRGLQRSATLCSEQPQAILDIDALAVRNGFFRSGEDHQGSFVSCEDKDHGA